MLLSSPFLTSSFSKSLYFELAFITELENLVSYLPGSKQDYYALKEAY
jgi:hypothetical protein